MCDPSDDYDIMLDPTSKSPSIENKEKNKNKIKVERN